MGALQDASYSINLVMYSLASCRSDVERGRETHRHDYTRPPASLGDELGGLSLALGLFASPPMIRSTESVAWVVVTEWKEARARRLQRSTNSFGGGKMPGRRRRETGTARAHRLGLS